MPGMTQESIRALKRRYKAVIRSYDDNFKLHWKDIADFTMPHHGRFRDRGNEIENSGKKKSQNILDPTATQSLNIAAAGMRGGLVPRSIPWFKLVFQDPIIMRQHSVRLWLGDVQDRMYANLNRSNFYQAAHDFFRELLDFGTAAMQSWETGGEMVFDTYTIGEFALRIDEFGKVDTMFRWQWMSARNMKNWFGEERLSQSVKSALHNDPDKEFKIIHAIFPRKDADLFFKDKTNMPWASVYWQDGATTLDKDDDEMLLRESGFREQSFFAARWGAVSESPYGTDSPGMTMLPDIKQLQIMAGDKLRAIEVAVNPPVVAPAGWKGRINLLPGGKNFLGGLGGDGLKPVYQLNPPLADISNEIVNVQQRVKEGFFSDLFRQFEADTRQMTATEIAQRNENKLTILGPTFERLDTEFLSPVIDRLWAFMLRTGQIPPAPPEVQGMEFKVEHISLLAQAQKQVATQSIDRTMSAVSVIAPSNPEVLDNFDLDLISREYSNSSGMSSRLLRTPEEVAKIRQDRAQAQAAQAQAEQAKLESEALRNTAQASAVAPTETGI